jgi:3-dehydroquinate dehydratase-1
VRLQSKNKVNVRNITIGGQKVLICLPLVAEDRSSLLQQAQDMVPLKPDLFEWRIDSYNGVENITDAIETLKALRNQIGPAPLIFTCRISLEGGVKKLPQEHRLNLIKAAIGSGHVDIIDVEMCNEPTFMDAVKTESDTQGTKLIFSYHDFESTPEETYIYEKLKQAQCLGADIAKLAVMPHGYEDVLTLLNATLRARYHGVQIPVVTMAMGAKGSVTRIAGGLFGSDITFAMGTAPSAPGQIHIKRLRCAMGDIYE